MKLAPSRRGRSEESVDRRNVRFVVLTASSSPVGSLTIPDLDVSQVIDAGVIPFLPHLGGPGELAQGVERGRIRTDLRERVELSA